MQGEKTNTDCFDKVQILVCFIAYYFALEVYQINALIRHPNLVAFNNRHFQAA